jgi:hypothetical protein
MQNETALHFDYSQRNYAVRTDLADAYREVWHKIASAGNWFNGEDRVAIVAEVRAAHTCDLCQNRKSALSPFTTKGAHQSGNTTMTNLTVTAVDVVHRLTTDASRLTQIKIKRVRRM